MDIHPDYILFDLEKNMDIIPYCMEQSCLLKYVTLFSPKWSVSHIDIYAAGLVESKHVYSEIKTDVCTNNLRDQSAAANYEWF